MNHHIPLLLMACAFAMTLALAGCSITTSTDNTGSDNTGSTGGTNTGGDTSGGDGTGDDGSGDDGSGDDGSGGDSGSAPSVEGTWVACIVDGDIDLRESLAFTATSFSYEDSKWTSADASCTGTETENNTDSGTYSVGDAVDALLGTEPVTANAIDFDFGGDSVIDAYQVYFIDTSVTPNALYIGDETAIAGEDASGPDARPTVLQDWKPRYRQD